MHFTVLIIFQLFKNWEGGWNLVKKLTINYLKWIKKKPWTRINWYSLALKSNIIIIINLIIIKWINSHKYQ